MYYFVLFLKYVQAITSLINLRTKLLKIYEVCPSLDINLNLFATNFPIISILVGSFESFQSGEM